MTDPRVKRAREAQPPDVVAGPDGLTLKKAEHDNLNRCVHKVLIGAASPHEAQTVLTWLRDITINTVPPATASDGELRIHQGKCLLYAAIGMRSSMGQRGQ